MENSVKNPTRIEAHWDTDDTGEGWEKEYKGGVLVREESISRDADGATVYQEIKYQGNVKHITKEWHLVSDDNTKRHSIKTDGQEDENGKFSGEKSETYEDFTTMKFTSHETYYKNDEVESTIEIEGVYGDYEHTVTTSNTDTFPRVIDEWERQNGECTVTLDGILFNKYFQIGGKKHGEEVIYYDEGPAKGKPHYIRNWKEGVPHGFSTELDGEGKIVSKDFYVNGCRNINYAELKNQVSPQEPASSEGKTSQIASPQKPQREI